ncbi:UDP-N-acetylmuramoyl-tripeptide--D-alanyl-D-alanine ligase [Flavobacterium sp. CYK-4]|uniref:UDP-N-acetylmuramoyl-tripeptide--D-alanyl-D- alanine ligase n=1 Tax=Flavobacterium lotistagni TaxID=2709660 RepID=UPI0014097D8C|nr:UDP-N-acetylmuramoyl-tripeptide--D-alanyl-D-alanine ligase [Flavobacterium lotistagni]NHM08192.1 UDP-N-acetylmuramoyl-tripeptide--D-alanyl-D-alanine ligase [Flavobacterium lotistagni]
MDISQIHQCFLQCQSISIDTRKIQPGGMFVAIKGERFDANTFAQEAIDKGASFVIIDNPTYFINEKTILVNDSLIALQELAKFHRNYLKLPIIALTGSNGKTTTKELIHVVLSKKFKTKATDGNLNNHIGVPLTLLSFDSNTEIGIVEMGANHQKEIAFLCEIAQPDYGYITNFGKAHLEGFGGVQGVIKGKSEMYDYLSEHHKKVFVNLDDSIQEQKTRAMDRITFGVNHSQANTSITSVVANPFVEIGFSYLLIHSHLIGLYNANNINAAVTIGRYFGVSDTDIQQAIEHYIPENNRSQLVQKNSNEIILDAYNANPSSMAVALDNFSQLKEKNKIVVLGDMFELGEESLKEHQAIMSLLEHQTAIDCYFVGKDFYQSRIEQPHFHFYETFESFAQELQKLQWKNQMILIKGSRGMALERVLEFL